MKRALGLRLEIRNGTSTRVVEQAHSTVFFGRLEGPEGVWVVVDDLRISRRHLRLEVTGERRLVIDVMGKPVRLAGGRVLKTGETAHLDSPVQLRVGATTLRISTTTLKYGTLVPPSWGPNSTTSTRALGSTPEAAALAGWFEAMLSVLSATTGGASFSGRAARAVVELIGLDRGVVLLRNADKWVEVARHAVDPQDDGGVSRSLLALVAAHGRTYYEVPDGGGGESLALLEAVVASPVLDPDGTVIGVVFGSRDASVGGLGQPISQMQARMVQVLAAAVSAGLARVAQEAEAARLRLQYEAFFSAEVAAQLERDPNLLEATEREITVLFADVRGFSVLADRLPPEVTYACIADLLDVLTLAVHAHGGVVVDYYGDGLEAMWNAPTTQSDHALCACQAALAIQAAMGDLNARWRARVGGALRVGVGIHTGRALVGNAGSRTRVKYGPRGSTVNVASRVEGATKQFGVGILATTMTVEAAGNALVTRTVGPAELRGIAEPVALFEVLPTAEIPSRT